MADRDLLKHAFEESEPLFTLLAEQRTRRMFKGFSKDISGTEIHGGTGRRLAFEGERFEPLWDSFERFISARSALRARR